MISAICWIPKGAAKKAEPPTDEEIDKPSLDHSSDCDYDDNNMDDYDDNDMDIVDGAQGEDAIVQAKDVAKALSRENPGDSFDYVAAGLRELNMESYDKEEDGLNILGSGSEELYYPTNDMDPYLKKDDGEDDVEAEEIEDMTVKPTDMMIATVHNEEFYNYIKVVILEELEDGEQNMYPYLEIPLRHFPLCLAWSDCGLKDGQKGNFLAVGTMGPEIEIWDLNIVDWFEPHIVLGGKLKNKKGKSKKMLRYKKGSHSDSILGIAWNMEYKNILASASADNRVKIWDVDVGKCVTTLEYHDSKVQAVAWSQRSPEIILSGSFDKSVALKDVKNCASDCIKWSVEADVETVAWDPHNENSFVVSLENGMVQAFDMRASSSQNSSSAMFTLHAHEKAVSTISFGPSAPNLLATASTDKMVKLWDISNNQPSCIASLNLKVGAIFSVSFSNDSPFLLAVGGSKGDVKVWNTLTEASVAKKFGRYDVHTDTLVAICE